MTLSEMNDNPSITTAEIYDFNPHYKYHCDVMQVIISLHLFRGKEKKLFKYTKYERSCLLCLLIFHLLSTDMRY